MKLWQIIVILLSLNLLTNTYRTPTNKCRVLVLSDNMGVYVTHSLFFDEIKNLGYTVEFKNLQSASLNLISYGEYNYDHIVIFSTTEEEIKGIKAREIFQFFDNGGNLIILGSPDQSKYFRHVMNGFGVDMHELGTHVYDHFNNINSDAVTVTTRNVIKQEAFVSKINQPIIYRGAGLSLTPYESNLVHALVRGSETAYSKLIDQEEMVVGQNNIFVTATQGRNNARVVMTGGWDIFSNEFLIHKSYDNLNLLRGLVKWSFGQSGILKAGELIHKRVGSTETFPQNYKLQEDCYFSTEIWLWDSDKERWVPFEAPQDDIVMEFIMLDPYYRVPLQQNKKEKAKYEIEFKIPDKYGIFHFKVTYFRPGFSNLNIAEKVTVRPFRHDEYPRYLVQAFPYYFSSFGTMLGFLIFIVFFLFHKGRDEKVE